MSVNTDREQYCKIQSVMSDGGPVGDGSGPVFWTSPTPVGPPGLPPVSPMASPPLGPVVAEELVQPNVENAPTQTGTVLQKL